MAELLVEQAGKARVRQAGAAGQAGKCGVGARHLHSYRYRGLDVGKVECSRSGLADAFTRAAQCFQHPHVRSTAALG